MLLILKHREHGTKIAGNEYEAQQDESNGWVRVQDIGFNPFEETAVAEAITVIEKAMTVEPVEELPQSDPKMLATVPKFDRAAHMKRMWAEGRMKKVKTA